MSIKSVIFSNIKKMIFFMWLFSTVFTSCKKESDDVLLLDRITFDTPSGIIKYKFEYDSHGRLTLFNFQINASQYFAMTSIGYHESGEISNLNGRKVERTGDVITVSSGNTSAYTYSLSSDQLEITTHSTGATSTFRYDGNGNITEIFYSSLSYHLYCEKYDGKKSPFYSCATPAWVFAELFPGYGFGTVNNPCSLTGDDTSISYTYEYNSAGYPTKRKSKGEIVDYTYRKK